MPPLSDRKTPLPYVPAKMFVPLAAIAVRVVFPRPVVSREVHVVSSFVVRKILLPLITAKRMLPLMAKHETLPPNGKGGQFVCTHCDWPEAGNITRAAVIMRIRVFMFFIYSATRELCQKLHRSSFRTKLPPNQLKRCSLRKFRPGKRNEITFRHEMAEIDSLFYLAPSFFSVEM